MQRAHCGPKSADDAKGSLSAEGAGVMLSVARAALFAMVPAELALAVLLVSGVSLPGPLIAGAEAAVIAVLLLEAATAYRLFRAERRSGSNRRTALRAAYGQLLPEQVRRIMEFDLKGMISLALWIAGRRHGVPHGATPVSYSRAQNSTMMLFLFAMVVELVGAEILLRAFGAPVGRANPARCERSHVLPRTPELREDHHVARFPSDPTAARAHTARIPHFAGTAPALGPRAGPAGRTPRHGGRRRRVAGRGGDRAVAARPSRARGGRMAPAAGERPGQPPRRGRPVRRHSPGGHHRNPTGPEGAAAKRRHRAVGQRVRPCHTPGGGHRRGTAGCPTPSNPTAPHGGSSRSSWVWPCACPRYR